MAKHISFTAQIDIQDFMAIDAFFRKQGFVFAGKSALMRHGMEYLARLIKSQIPEVDFDLQTSMRMFKELYNNPLGKWNRNSLTLIRDLALEEQSLNTTMPEQKARPDSEIVKSVLESLTSKTESVNFADLSKALADIPKLNMEGDDGT